MNLGAGCSGVSSTRGGWLALGIASVLLGALPGGCLPGDHRHHDDPQPTDGAVAPPPLAVTSSRPPRSVTARYCRRPTFRPVPDRVAANAA